MIIKIKLKEQKKVAFENAVPKIALAKSTNKRQIIDETGENKHSAIMK